LPKARRYAVLLNPANAKSAEATTKSLKAAARALGLETLFFNAGNPGEVNAAFAAFVREGCEALFIAGDDFFASRAVQLANLASRDRIPACFTAHEMAEAGLLMSYGTDFVDTFRQIGVYTGSILKGAKPADLPVIQSTKFEFVINLQTARLLGLDVTPTLLATADKVIE
jgi:putative tryptophan/tyrosine transport system substrate-binding protein